MRVESLNKPIKYFLPAGEVVLLRPGHPVHLPDSVIDDLLNKAPAYIRVLSEVNDGPALDPALADPPIKPTWFISFFVDRKYHGGPTGGDVGRVQRSVFDGRQWVVYTVGGWKLLGRQVHEVWPVDRTGAIGEGWRVKTVGMNGHGYPYQTTCTVLARAGVRVDTVDTLFATLPDPSPMTADASRPHLCDLSPEQRTTLQRAFRLSPSVFQALSTGAGSPDTWDRFWTPAGPDDHGVSTRPCPKPGRDSITIETVQGTRELRAWICGPLAIHRSVAVAGWSLTHVKSGKKVLSRIETKERAVAAAETMLPLTDWTVANPIPTPRLIAYLTTVPRDRRKGRV